MKKIFKRIGKMLYRNTTNELCYEEIITMKKNSPNLVLIDVRSVQEYNEGHLDGAICIPLQELKREIIQKIKDENTIIILYCASGIRSLKGKNILEDMGYKNIYHLKGGINNI